MVSHELKSPIAALLGALPLAEDALASGETATGQRLLAIAMRNAERMKRLVDDLMDVHAMDEGHLTLDLKSVELSEIVSTVLADLEPTARSKQLRFAVTQPQEPIRLNTDPNRLSQAIVNIVANAIRFSPIGGIITINMELSANQAVIRIDDQGPGIPEEFRDKLFTRFSRVAGDHAPGTPQGTGLGLFISQNILHELSGGIQLDSQYKSGARFIIRLPTEQHQAGPGSERRG